MHVANINFERTLLPVREEGDIALDGWCLQYAVAKTFWDSIKNILLTAYNE